MIIDFDKREVEGSFGYIAEDRGWDGADINCSATFIGTVDLETNKISADGAVEFKGMGPDYTGGWIEWDGTIASDYKSAQGGLLFWDGCRWNWNGTVK